MQVLVLGMHRSGTSVLTRVLERMGCFTGEPGDFNPPEPDDPQGYHERSDVWQVDEAVLAHLGATWYDLGGFDLAALAPEDRSAFEARAAEVVARLAPHRPWAIKDPRLSLLLPLWRPALEQPFVVLVWRRPLEVARSLAARDALPLPLGIALWELYNLAALAASAGLPRLLLAHGELVAHPAEVAGRLHRALVSAGAEGLAALSEEQVGALVDPSLYRARADAESEIQHLDPAQARLLEALAEGRAFELSPLPALSPGAAETLLGFGRLRAERDRLVVRNDEIERSLQRTNERLATLTASGKVEDAESLAEEVAALRRTLAGRDRELEALAGWILDLDRVISAIFESRRWRLGDALAGLGRRLLPQQPAAPTAADHHAALMREFRRWQAGQAGEPESEED